MFLYVKKDEETNRGMIFAKPKIDTIKIKRPVSLQM